MTVYEALVGRKSVRAFLKKPVETEKITAILEGAKHAPSGVNMQPWEVAVLQGESKKSLEAKMVEAFYTGSKEKMDYQYYPLEWKEPFKSRRKACGLLIYETLKITREDTERQKEQWAANYRAFDAPVMLLFFMRQGLETGSFLDYGMFLQSVMLMAQSEGLATCPQAALAEYPSIVKKELGYEQHILICGMALGYEDKNAAINNYRIPRENIKDFVRFYDGN